MPKFTAVIYEFVRAQAEKLNLSLEQFEELVDGDDYDRMKAAFLEEWIGFFPPESRHLLRQMTTQGKELHRMLMAKAMTDLEAAAKAMGSESSESSTSALASLGSTQSP